jgi:hypothetical protein
VHKSSLREQRPSQNATSTTTLPTINGVARVNNDTKAFLNESESLVRLMDDISEISHVGATHEFNQRSSMDTQGNTNLIKSPNSTEDFPFAPARDRPTRERLDSLPTQGAAGSQAGFMRQPIIRIKKNLL